MFTLGQIFDMHEVGDAITITLQEIGNEFGEFIRRDICGDTHIVVDVKKCA